MAITLREPGASLLAVMTLLGLGAAWTSALAQPTAAEPGAEPAQVTQVTQIQPTVDMTLTATNNANGTTSTDTPRRDVILSTGVGADINIKGANSQLAGRWRFTSVKYARNTQPSRVLPSGLLELHSDLYRKEAGLDASLSSEQTATTVGTTPDANNTANTTTTTRFSLSPFFTRRFDADSSLTARLKRTWIRSSSNDSNQADNDGAKDEHLLRWERQPMPLGYALQARYDKDPIFPTAGSNLPKASLTRKRATASLLYAIVPELAVGPIVGRESSQYESQKLNGTISGGQLRWRPNEHMQLNAQLTHSVFGKEWDLDTSRKTAWTTFGFNSRREVETNAAAASTAGLAALSALGSTGSGAPTLPTTGSAPVGTTNVAPGSQANNLSAASRETTSGRIRFAGRRDTFNFSAGLTRVTPLVQSSSPALRTKEYFFDTEVIHKLTPLSDLSGGLRWTRGATFAATTGEATPSRDFIARVGLNTRLAPDTTATMGFKRQLTHNPSTRTSAESAAYVGLGHRF